MKIHYRFCYLLGLLLVLWGVGWSWFSSKENLSPSETQHQLAMEYGVSFVAGNNGVLSKGLTSTELSVLRFKPIGHHDQNIVMQGLQMALKKYSPAFIKNYLHDIRLTSTLDVQGIAAAGSFSTTTSSIFLAVNSSLDAYGATYYADTFHHELSSLFVYKGPFPVKQWNALLPAGFHYQRNFYGHCPCYEQSKHTMSEWHQLGFMSDYGATRLDNDVNTYAEVLFEHPDNMKTLMSRYPAIRNKARLLAQAYVDQAPHMRSFFEKAYGDSILKGR